MVRTIRTREELESVIDDGVGFLYNDFGGRKPQDCPIHAVSCSWVRTMLNVRPGSLGVKKLWSASLDELIREVTSRGKVYSFCRSESLEAPTPSSLSVGTRATAPPSPRTATAHPAAATQTPEHPEYRLKIHDPDRGPLDVWSSGRLQFEPKGWMRVMRDDIGAALLALVAQPGELLHAVYASMSRETVDTENVLFYNVGTGRFASAAKHGLLFERRFVEVPAPTDMHNQPSAHHVAYELRASQDPRYWKRGPTLAEWKAVPCPPLHEFARLSEIWLDMKQASEEIRCMEPIPNGAVDRFGIEIAVSIGDSGSRNVAAFVKPLLDGAIAAFHSHDGSDEHELGARLASRLHISPDEALALLRDTSLAVLGKRRLLWRWGDSVQWNPADDLCVVGRVVVAGAAASRHWSHSGRIFSVRSLD